MKQNEFLTLDGMECCVLVDTTVKNVRYLYVAELKDEDITGNFYLYKVVEENKYEKVTNSEQLKSILPVVIAEIKRNE